MANQKTEEHKEKIRQSMIGKISSIKKKQKISEAFSNGNHPKSMLWTIQDPNGKVYITKNIKELCKRFNLSYSTLRLRHQQKNSSPIWSGSAKGWAVLNTEMTRKLTLEPFIIVD